MFGRRRPGARIFSSRHEQHQDAADSSRRCCRCWRCREVVFRSPRRRRRRRRRDPAAPHRADRAGRATPTSISSCSSRARTGPTRENFARAEIVPGATRVSVKERDREPLRGTLPGNGYRLSVDVFVEFGARARNTTWQLDVKRVGDDAGAIAEPGSHGAGREPLPAVAQSRETVRRASADDLGRGSGPDADRGLGVRGRNATRAPPASCCSARGEARFHPAPEVEKGQLKIFCGADVLQTRFDATYVRMNPQDVAALVDAEPPDAAAGRCARAPARRGGVSRGGAEVVRRGHGRPEPRPVVAPAGRRRFSRRDPHRALRHPDLRAIARPSRRTSRSSIASGTGTSRVYSSKEARERFGRSYNEDDFVSYDVLGYDIDLAVSPDRSWLEGRARLQIRVLATAINSITLRLAESLDGAVDRQRSVRPPARRARPQPEHDHRQPAGGAAARRRPGADHRLRRPARAAARRHRRRRRPGRRPPAGPGRRRRSVFLPERSFLYSNRSYWYPQATVTDYATASLRHHGAGEYRLRGERHARRRLSDGGRRQGFRASRGRSICSRRRSRCAISRSCSAGSRAASRSTCRSVPTAT